MKKVNIQGCLISISYFEKTHKGNLLVEFSNNRSGIVSTEATGAQPKSPGNEFTGKYNTTSRQNGEAFFVD